MDRNEWLQARKAFLVKEKEHTRATDAITAARHELPMVKVDKEYTFTGPDKTAVSLSDLFAGKDQLLVYHYMFGPTAERGCSGCAHVAEAIPDLRHLHERNTHLVCVSRAPVEKLEKFKKSSGWEFPWYSSDDGDFSYDFYATADDGRGTGLVNFQTKEEQEAKDGKHYTGDVPGFSSFWKKDGEIYHTYSTFNRGVDHIMPTFGLLDLTALGRQDTEDGPGGFTPPDKLEKKE